VTITRTFTIDDLSPEELAALFADMHGEQQALFFSEVGKIAATWPGAGMCMQALSIAENLDASGRYVIERIADHAGLIPATASS
jgi:hypothetical protein